MYKRFIILAGLLCIINYCYAKENVSNTSTVKRQALLKATATGCLPATAAIDLDINNVRARLMTGGDMWWNIGTQVAAYEIPKGSGKSSQFAASCWIGGIDANKQLKVAAQTYRQDGNDYWPGALDNSGAISPSDCSAWDQFWKVDKSLINSFISDYNSGKDVSSSTYDVINHWPGRGNGSAAGVNMAPGHDYAPFADLNGDGNYEPSSGEYPLINGDEYIWWVFNDAGNIKEQSQTAAMGIEVQTSAFAYASQDFLNNATFINYRVINRGSLTIDSTYIAVWDDCDLGYAYDDFIGCDTSRGLGIQYNGKSVDGEGEVNSYGSDIPQVGVDFFQGPKRPAKSSTGADSTIQLGLTNFTYYNNDFSVIGNPSNGIQIYYYMTGSVSDGEKFSDDFLGAGIPTKGYGSGPISHYVYWGDPSDHSQWSECVCNNNPNDRRFIASSGPFTLVPGAINDITFGCVWAPGVGGCPNTNFKTITSIDDQAQALFDAGFKTLNGPEAPLLTVRELDEKLVFYLENPYGSNNYKEQYGRVNPSIVDSAVRYNEVSVKAKANHNPDSLYKFEGYRVFQLKNANISSADIFNSNGEVNTDNAIEVFQCDIRNGVTKLVNFGKNSTYNDNTFVPQLKVVGRDSGIVHSFELSTSAFTPTTSGASAIKHLINYQSYYFVAIAYAYNDFSYDYSNNRPGFDPDRSDSTQDMPYLGSTHGPNSTAISVVSAMPNPANGNMGTVLNSDYGSGVIVHRIEGIGNGGIAIQLDSASENEALAYKVAKVATYVQDSAPIKIKVIDPVKVVAADWKLFVTGPEYAPSSALDSNVAARQGIIPAGGSWHIVVSPADGSTPEDIYSEESIATLNEQILDKYGLSVSIKQVQRPGDNQPDGNGYISSSISFADGSQPWLSGVPDASDSSFLNWIRSGNNSPQGLLLPCDYHDSKYDTTLGYATLLTNYAQVTNTWAPYSITAFAYATSSVVTSPINPNLSLCPFTIAYSSTSQSPLYALPSVDIVFTSDKTKWTRCLVLEEQEDPNLSEGGVKKFGVRSHRSWNMDADKSGNTPVYATDKTDTGFSYFPGYAINQETGERLNIIFGEDSYLGADNGKDMLWNPSANILNSYDNSVIFGGKHYVYILNTRYDSDAAFYNGLHPVGGSLPPNITIPRVFNQIQWTGMPIASMPLTPLSKGLIPTETRLRFRVNRPFATYIADSSAATLADHNNNGQPYYTFSTNGLQPTPVSDATNKKSLLDRIGVVPNPYLAQAGYETNRLDTRVRIINLPAKAEVYIYALDGSLIRSLTKSDAGTSYIDWDIRNAAGLPIASGMYMIDVKAEGIGETVLRWFGAMRPIDITTY